MPVPGADGRSGGDGAARPMTHAPRGSPPGRPLRAPFPPQPRTDVMNIKSRPAREPLGWSNPSAPRRSGRLRNPPHGSVAMLSILCLMVAGSNLGAAPPGLDAAADAPTKSPENVAAPDDGVVRTLAGLDRLPGTYLVEGDDLPRPVVVFDTREGAPRLSVRPREPVSIVTLLKNVPAGPPPESYAQIAAEREDRLEHIRTITLADPIVQQAVSARGGPASGAADGLRIVSRRHFYILNGRRPGEEVLPDDPPQVYVKPQFLISIPSAAGETLAYYSPMNGPGDPDEVPGELWQYRVPDDAPEGTGPRWVRTKKLTGGGSFHPMIQPFHPPQGL